MEEKLIGPTFLKVHRSYIVNINKIDDIRGNTIYAWQSDSHRKRPQRRPRHPPQHPVERGHALYSKGFLPKVK
jgi:hypothetical protein